MLRLELPCADLPTGHYNLYFITSLYNITFQSNLILFSGKYASEDKMAASCVEYFKYGVMAKGYYYLNISWKEFKSVEQIFRFHNVKRVFCGYYGKM